jgi:hypothetical protein
MQYQVSRNGQTYGPYTLEDLQRYVASGNVLLSDLAKSEEMPDWLPVAQILNVPAQAAPPPSYQPSYSSTPHPAMPYPLAAYPDSANQYPDPPNLHWGLLLLLGILTLGLFTVVYDIIQILWLKKINPTTKVLAYYIAFIVLEVLNISSSIGRAALLQQGNVPPNSGASVVLSTFISIGVLVMFIVYRFTMRSELEQHFNGPEPLGLRLGGIMTFFFGGLYFQYHFNRLNLIKQTLRYRPTP